MFLVFFAKDQVSMRLRPDIFYHVKYMGSVRFRC